MNNNLSKDLQNDIMDVVQISAIPSILNIICRITGMKFASVSRVTEDKWITCLSHDEINFGIETGDEFALETNLGNKFRQYHNPIIIEEFEKSDAIAKHQMPLYHSFQSYISYPIFRKGGRFFGTLCAVDPKPAKIDNKEVRELFVLYAQLISFHLDAIEEVRVLTASLREERHIGELRETFIAVLGHDLRNPVGTMRMCADILLQMELPELANRQASTIKSTSYRMQGLIDNLLDFAKGHLGEGIQLDFVSNNQALKKALKQISKEIKTIYIEHEINLSIELNEDVKCDINRISQLYSNLLENAMKHGTTDQPIVIDVKSENGIFSIAVSNSGTRIPEKKMMNLFRPFFSSNSANNKSGLGLGLYISSEIAKAHGGKLEVTSTDEKTAFRFSMSMKKLGNLNQKSKIK